MATGKPEVMIEVPRTGVRKDVNELIQTPEMAAKGENCIFYDGTIRPRPAVSNQGFGTDFAPAWEQIYDDGDISGWRIWAMVQLDNGDLLASVVNDAETDQKFMYSADNGASWQDSAFAHPLSGGAATKVRWMEIFSGYLFMYSSKVIVDPGTHVPGEYLHRSSLASYPTAMTFTNIGPLEQDVGGGTYFSQFEPGATDVTYDSTSGSLVFMCRSAAALYASDITVWQLKDALTTTLVADRVKIGGEDYPVGIGGSTIESPKWINKQFIMTPQLSYLLGFPSYVTRTRIIVQEMYWDSTTGAYVWGDELDPIQLYSNSTPPYDFPTVSDDPDLTPYPKGGTVDLGDGYFLQPLVSSEVYEFSSTKKRVEFLKGKINDQGSAVQFSVDPYISSSIVMADNGIGDKCWDFAYNNSRIAGIVSDSGTDPALMVGMTSDDDGKTFKISAPGGYDAFAHPTHLVPTMMVNEETYQHYVANSALTATNDYAYGEIWYSPTSGGASIYGDVTTVFQMDMDDEDEVVVCGTTKALMRLDVDTNDWVRITADHDETVPGDPATTWVNNGDIPPLSVSDDRDEYVSGTTINSTYGENPWIFRTTEVQGNSVLIATNGQCRPVLYHPDLNGGFARRLGEVPAGESVNDLPLWDADSFPDGYLRSGNLAPVARCLASAANRLLLGNLVGTSPYGIDVSGFNDPDRGWGLEQTTLLGDTPGPLVSMNEISALSVALYKSDAIYHAIAQTEFMGVAAPFRFELSKIGVAGPCSPASVLKNFDGRHIYMGRDGGVYMYDGVAPIDGGRNIRRMIQGSLNPNEYGKVWGMVDRQRKLVWFFYPSKDGLVNRGLVISTDQGFPWPAWPVSLPAGWNFVAGHDVSFQNDTDVGNLQRLGNYTEESLGSFTTGDQHLLMGTQNNLWYSQKWDDDGDYSDDGEPIQIQLEPGWTTPGELRIHHAEELYHIFSSQDPTQTLQVMLKAQQIGQNILTTQWRDLYAGKKRRRTRHRIRGVQFKPSIRGSINRMFNWGGAVMKLAQGGHR